MEITEAMVSGYATAVAAALRDAGHPVTDPFINDQGAMASSVVIVIPDALNGEHGRSGLALMWHPTHGWDAGIVWRRTLSTMRISTHTDLRLGVKPRPGVVVDAVTAIVANGSLMAGRVGHGRRPPVIARGGDR